MASRSYRDLKVWQLARENAVAVYELTETWPGRERFGLISQIRAAAASVAANIAEGQGRGSPGQFAYHLGIAHGSLCEVETFLTISVDLGYTPREDALELWDSLSKCGKFLQALKRQQERVRR